MPRAKTKPEQASEEIEAVDPAEIASEPVALPDDQLPAVGESVTFCVWNAERGTYTENAALITYVSPTFTVDLIVFARHSRAGRPFQGVKYRPENVQQEPTDHWRYPEAFAIDENNP